MFCVCVRVRACVCVREWMNGRDAVSFTNITYTEAHVTLAVISASAV